MTKGLVNLLSNKPNFVQIALNGASTRGNTIAAATTAPAIAASHKRSGTDLFRDLDGSIRGPTIDVDDLDLGAIQALLRAGRNRRGQMIGLVEANHDERDVRFQTDEPPRLLAGRELFRARQQDAQQEQRSQRSSTAQRGNPLFSPGGRISLPDRPPFPGNLLTY